jgi:hypothetical protein
MTKEEILKMVKDIVEEIDYDIYKDIFMCPEDIDESAETINNLVSIVEDHLLKNG